MLVLSHGSCSAASVERPVRFCEDSVARFLRRLGSSLRGRWRRTTFVAIEIRHRSASAATRIRLPSPMLQTFTVETFQPRVGEPFRVIVDDDWQMITILSEVSPWGHEEAKSRPRIPFSLTFHARPDAVIPQAIYRLENENMEPFDAFLVPIGADAGGMRYEAVFT
jgi:hypothetical protein